MSERAILVGFLLFVVVILPVLLVRDYRQRRERRKILDSYRSGKSHNDSEGEGGDPASPPGFKGWGMNNSPFRERKSGLTWGGGNIKASNARRGTRKKFLK